MLVQAINIPRFGLKTLAVIFLCNILTTKVEAQVVEFDEKYIPATVYTSKNGLSSNNIQDIVQDDDGFIWLATQNGLNRFDSINFTNYYRDKSDEFSLPDALVEQIVLMPNNQLWLSINNVGITVFDKFTKKFTSAKNDKSALFEMPSNNLFGIAKDNTDNLWFSIYGDGIYQWQVAQQEFIEHSNRNKQPWLTSDKNYEILIDSKNRLWVCTIDSMVYQYDINTKTSKDFNFAKDVSKPASSPIYIFVESNNEEVYAAGYSGVFKYNETSKLFDTVVSEQSMTQFFNGTHASVKTMLADSKDNLWIGTTNGLLLYSDGVLSSINFYENGETRPANWTTNSIIEGYDGNIWIGTEGAGLFKLAPDWDRYNIYISENKEAIDIRGAYLYENKIWVVHSSSKIDLLQLHDDKLLLKRTLEPGFGDDAIRIDDFQQFNDGYFWLSAVNGIHKVNTQTGSVEAVTDSEGSGIGITKSFVKAKNSKFYYNLFSDKSIGYFEENDLIGQEIKNTSNNHLVGDMVLQMLNGLDDNIWLATNRGIEALDIQTHHYKMLYESPSEHDVSWIHFDNTSQIVWVIVDGGLQQFLWENDKLVLQEDKFNKILPLLIFSSIQSLNRNTLLITTKENGLVELNTSTLEYKVYNIENGLPSDVTTNVLFPQQTPMIVTEAGIALYNQRFIEAKQIKPKFKIDTLKLGETSLDLIKQNNIELEHSYGSLNFNLALLSYTNASSVEYEYMLDGIHEKWNNTGNDDNYSFHNLPAGSYTFKARGRSNYGLWSDIEEYSFRVKPPIWATIWAYLLYAALVLSMLYWIFYLYKRKLLYENKIVKEQTQKQLANQASKAKSDFLARVSHEVRTPLNGVLGMSELMLDTQLDEEQKIYADTIITSGNHLLDIINDILDLSKIESGKLELETHSFDLLLLIDEIIGSFTSQAKQKKLLFTSNFSHDILRNRIGDVIRIKQILFNLLSNAFKFTKHGEVTLNINHSKTLKNGITITVEDTGIGINNETIEDLFKPFVQADSATTRKYGGTGLGLAIVKQLVEKMKGTILAQGKPNGGSVFSIELPLEIDINKPIQQENLNDVQVGVFIQEKNLKHSLVEYCVLLGVEVNDIINTKTQCVFIDVMKCLNIQQLQQIEMAEKLNVQVIYIGFDLDNLPKSLLHKTTVRQLTTPPVTFKKLQKLCDDSIHEQALLAMPEYKVATRELKILVVEDNIINQQVSIEMLERMGHIVDIVDNAEEALIMLYRNDYDLLLSDYHLPGMDGLNLIKNWSNPNSIPIIMVTADLSDIIIQECGKLEIYNIVAKPFTQQALFSAIEKALIN